MPRPMRVWKKLVAANAEEAWLERLRFVGESRLAVVALPGKRTVRIEAYALSKHEARSLVARFGGRIRQLRADFFAEAARPRAPIRIRDRILVVASDRERELAARRFPDRK